MKALKLATRFNKVKLINYIKKHIGKITDTKIKTKWNIILQQISDDNSTIQNHMLNKGSSLNNSFNSNNSGSSNVSVYSIKQNAEKPKIATYFAFDNNFNDTKMSINYKCWSNKERK